jgi:hypothetical protein
MIVSGKVSSGTGALSAADEKIILEAIGTYYDFLLQLAPLQNRVDSLMGLLP